MVTTGAGSPMITLTSAYMTVLENLVVAQHNTLMRASGFTVAGILGIGGYRRAEKEAVEKSKYWLDKIHLIDRADDPAGDLPYGAQRRLEIARAMGCRSLEFSSIDPELEPYAGAAAPISRTVIAIARSIVIGIVVPVIVAITPPVSALAPA